MIIRFSIIGAPTQRISKRNSTGNKIHIDLKLTQFQKKHLIKHNAYEGLNIFIYYKIERPED